VRSPTSRLRGRHERGQNGGVTGIWVFAVIFFLFVIALFVFITRR
jgi:uncharacterized membrane protein